MIENRQLVYRSIEQAVELYIKSLAEWGEIFSSKEKKALIKHLWGQFVGGLLTLEDIQTELSALKNEDLALD